MGQVHRSDRDHVAVLTVDNPPVNSFNSAVREALAAKLDQGIADPEVQALVLTGAGKLFGGGADIHEFGTPAMYESPTLRDLVAMVEHSPKPVTAAIHGVAVGGALELSLACHYRVASAGARLGLPEVTLGIVPGSGGTQRLPRLVGVRNALDMIVTGKQVPASEAREIGLVDDVVDGDVVAAAVSFAEQLLDRGESPRVTREIEIPDAEASDAICAEFRERVSRRARGVDAPARCIDAVHWAVKLPFEEGDQRERAIFLDLVNSEQARALRHVFFAEREVAKIPDVPRDTPTKPIERAAVIGCGTMGSGIAMNFANACIPVRVLEANQRDLDRGLERIRQTYASAAAKGRMTQEQVDERLALVEGTLNYEELADVDIAIEAVFEEMDLKRQVFQSLDTACKPGAILATNTSTLDVNIIANTTIRPDRVIGTHFFSPAHVMRLMENVRGDRASVETVATIMKLSKTLGKIGVLVGVCDGFVANRMLHPYFREAEFLLEEGALPQQVDRVMYDFGFAMGPFAVADLAGLDVGWRIRKRQEPARPKHLRYSGIADRICDMSRFGQKTGAGWYRYEKGSRTPIPDPAIEQLIVEASSERGLERREISDAEILQRCLYPLINEGAKLLEEGIALRASDIDVIWIHGYGFPRHRGGPMFYGDCMGVASIYETMCRFHAEHGELMEPASLLQELAIKGGSFGEL